MARPQSAKSNPSKIASPIGDPSALRAIAQWAQEWFVANHRDLPWRKTRDPYRIWISECMLQQTQVATVIPYYHRFLERFPDVQTLAAAELDEVYRFWAGLGYYRRARQLHAAAQQVVGTGQAPFPAELEAIEQLPGIGRYTASAIASFAYDHRCGIVEANTQRLYARLIGCKNPLSDSATQKKLWEFAEAVVAAWPGPSGALNQSLMEIGSQICKPKDPGCLLCPLQKHCVAFQKGQTASIPAAKPKKIITELQEIGLLVSDSKGRWLLRRRQPTERWAGLWDFPRYDCTEFPSDDSAMNFAQDEFFKHFGANLKILAERLCVQHSVTRYRIQLRCFEATLVGKKSVGKKRSSSEQHQYDWYSLEDLGTLALSSSGRKVADWLIKRAKG